MSISMSSRDWCGIDAADPSLAGPVVAAAVILPKNCEILYLERFKAADRKAQRRSLMRSKEKAVAYGIGNGESGTD